MDDTSETRLSALEHRVQTLETKVAAMPSVEQIETRIDEQVKAIPPPPPPPAETPAMPSFKDISVPLPSMQALVNTAKTTWTLIQGNRIKIIL